MCGPPDAWPEWLDRRVARPGLRHALRPSEPATKEDVVNVIIGIDAHKKTHTAVVIDEVGRELASKTVKATSDGHLRLVTWARQWPSRRFAVEDCRHLTRRLESDLLAAGERIVRVPPQLMAAERRGGRERGKSDPIDALAVARAALREPNLPVAELDGPTLRVRPDARVTAASPASASRISGAGKRSRSSPISASRTALNTGPTPGKLVKIGAPGCSASVEAIASS
jgi:hypothetical protein